MAVAAGAYCAYKAAQLFSGDADLGVQGLSVPQDWWEGKVVWITGASSGIGEAFAKEVAARGARVILSARRQAALEMIQASLAGSEQHMVLPLDAEDFASHTAAVEAVWDRYGRLDVLLLNAGRGGAALAEHTDFALSRKMMELNVLHCVSLTEPQH